MSGLYLKDQAGGSNGAVFSPAPQPESTIRTRAELESALIRFINEILPEIHPRLKARPRVCRSTPLFETGLIDSLAILDLIGFVEKVTGRAVPQRKVVMKFFRSVETIASSFSPEMEE